MKANELRIGNYIQDGNGKNQKITPSLMIAIIEGVIDFSKPIPLTEEWLLKFGFELSEKQYESQDFRVYVKGYFAWNSNHGWWFCNINIENKSKIKYVHQLQNLIFALTGEELTLKQ